MIDFATVSISNKCGGGDLFLRTEEVFFFVKYDITGDDSAASATPFSISEMTYGCAPGVTHTLIEERNKNWPSPHRKGKKT